MRDTFLLLWVGFLVIGVIGSIVSSARKQVKRAQSLQQPPRRIPSQWQPPQAQLPQGPLPDLLQRMVAQVAPPPPRVAPRPAAPKAPRPAPPPKPVVEAYHELAPARRHTRRLFDSRRAIVQAVIAAEVLGKPRGLRDEYF